jgi:RAD50-interacting protein 1
LPALQEAAEGAAPHLVDHILAQTSSLRLEIEKAFSTELEGVLKKMHWPTPGMTVPLALENDFQEGVRKLLELQKPELEAKEAAKDASRGSPLVLLPLQVMTRPLELAFRFHFEGDRPTNKLDRPEYFLAHITEKLLNQYADFMADNLQPILLEDFRGTTLSSNSAYIDATSAFITSLLPMVRAKIFAILPRVAKQPQLLSHLIHEIMSFDATIRDDWGYDGGNGTEGWRGLAYEILVMDDWFATWLKIEKECTYNLIFLLVSHLTMSSRPSTLQRNYRSP